MGRPIEERLHLTRNQACSLAFELSGASLNRPSHTEKNISSLKHIIEEANSNQSTNLCEQHHALGEKKAVIDFLIDGSDFSYHSTEAGRSSLKENLGLLNA